MTLPQFPDEARIWMYTSNRMVSESEQSQLTVEITAFLEQWAAHGTQLLAACAWLNEYQLVIALDESQAGASGCSIDSQTRFLRQLGEQHAIDWFNRMQLVLEIDGKRQLVSFFELSEFPDALLYDGLVQRLGDVRHNWPIKVGESRYSHLVS